MSPEYGALPQGGRACPPTFIFDFMHHQSWPCKPIGSFCSLYQREPTTSGINQRQMAQRGYHPFRKPGGKFLFRALIDLISSLPLWFPRQPSFLASFHWFQEEVSPGCLSLRIHLCFHLSLMLPGGRKGWVTSVFQIFQFNSISC